MCGGGGETKLETSYILLSSLLVCKSNVVIETTTMEEPRNNPVDIQSTEF